MQCQECYSEYARITPLYKPEDCLQRHEQYICSTCGRAICMDRKDAMKARCFMLFNTLEMAILYVRAAELFANDVCGIYEIETVSSGKIHYKMFESQELRTNYFTNNPDKRSCSEQPRFVSKMFTPAQEGQIRRLTPPEIQTYLQEYAADHAVRLALLTQ